MNPVVLSIAVGLALTAAYAHAQPTAADLMEAMKANQAYKACMVARARAADDGRVDATALAARIKDSCQDEAKRFVDLYNAYAAKTPGMTRDQLPPNDKERLELAKMAVEEERAQASH